MPTFRTACPYDCPDGCSLLAEVEDGRVQALSGDPANPYTNARICAKMARLPQAIHSPERILTPLRRTGAKGEGRFAPVCWDEAVAEITERWREIIGRYGAEAILPTPTPGPWGRCSAAAGRDSSMPWGPPGWSARCAAPESPQGGAPLWGIPAIWPHGIWSTAT